MSDQYRPQPYDDGPRTTVDPHLLPQRPASAASQPEQADAPKTTDAPVENPTPASEPAAVSEPVPEAPADAGEQPSNAFAVGTDGETSRETPAEGFDAPGAAPAGDARLNEAVARSRSIPVDETGAGATLDAEPDTAARAYDADAYGTDAPAAESATDANVAPLAMPVGAVNDRTDEPDIYADADPATTQLDDPVPATPTEAPTTSPTEGLIVEPDKRGNRGFAFFTALLAIVVFGALYAVAFAAARMIFTTGGDFVGGIFEFIGTAPFYVPVALFGIFLIVWSLIANRAGWWSYIVASLIAAVLTGGGYYVGVAFQDVVNGQPWSNDTFETAIRSAEHLPGALLAFIAGRESALWIGGIAALRGRSVKKRNAAERAEYERKVAEEREYEAQRTSITFDEGR
ncbi:hypothetical protein [Gulosibacter massiliensis]|uniref:hypothetical protein n=1 Tax=Gulosibacter massiliensis TaxID=2479839 RepID=UPI000F63889F|nr:hypothetical protein [Gulosibacter massiliensis]